MQVERHGVISESKFYKVEFTNSDEVAESGAYAEKQVTSLPVTFNPDDEESMKIFDIGVKRMCKDSKFDTAVLVEIKTTEYLFSVKKEGESTCNCNDCSTCKKS